MPRYAVFVNYRTDDTWTVANWLHKELSQRFGADKVFMAKESIEGGVEYPERMMDALRDSAVVVALVGKSWLASTDEHGGRRLDNPADWVRVELETALARGIEILPVAVDGGLIPDTTVLPASLERFALRQALPLSTDDFDEGFARVAARIEELLTGSEPPPIPDGWELREVTALGCRITFGLPRKFKQAKREATWAHGMSGLWHLTPRQVSVSTSTTSAEELAAQLERDPRFTESTHLLLPSGSAMRVCHRKKLFESLPKGGGQLAAAASDSYVVAVHVGTAASVTLTCTTVLRSIAEQGPLFERIARTMAVRPVA
jgi:hypothetical protein